MTSRSSATVKRRRAAMTPKQRVLKKYPQAFSCSFADQWVVYDEKEYSGTLEIGSGKGAQQAWADAARRLK